MRLVELQDDYLLVPILRAVNEVEACFGSNSWVLIVTNNMLMVGMEQRVCVPL